MRLVSLELAGFRGFAKSQTFDLDADAVVVVGANGYGKTSLFDGILWALCGRVPRLGDAADVVLSKFSDNGEVRVSLKLRSREGTECFISRVFDGKDTRLSFASGLDVAQGPSAEGKVIDLLWKEAGSAPDSQQALASVITRSVYLQQDLVREFVEAASEEDRFTAVSELIGAGRVADLQQQLERAKAAWSKATNSQQDELRPLRQKLATMEARLAEIVERKAQIQGDQLESRWASWWHRLENQGIKAVSQPFASREAATAIDAAIRLIEPQRRAIERRLQVLTALGSDISKLAVQEPVDVAPLRNKVEALTGELQETRRQIEIEQVRAAELRRSQASLHEQSEQLRALASLALIHLGPHCPVCDQEYDHDATRRRLELLAARGTQVSAPIAATEALPGLLAAMASKEAELSAAQLALHSGERADQERSALELAIGRRLSDLALDTQGIHDRMVLVERAIGTSSEQIRALEEMAKEGEALALLLTQASDQARLAELQRETEGLRATVNDREALLRKRSATGELGQQVIGALRLATSDVVTKRLNDVAPLLQTLYSRIDPHPAFRVVNFMTDVVRGKGQLYTVIQDPDTDTESNAPQTILSSSQLNALAVSVFLALNLSASQPPLSAAILDDPLQSLDDINLLALVDLLRRTKDGRQLCVSTHNARLGNLLARKLRPGSPDQRTILIEFDGWSREGPIVEIREIERDPAELRLVSG